MEQVKLTQGLSLSRIVAGCMRIVDARVTDEQLLTFAKQCIALGVDTFDHAPVYGGYTCEKRFGDAVLRKDPSLRKQMKIVTKTGIVLPKRYGNACIYYDSTKAQILHEMDESLTRLGTDYVDVLLVHRPDPLADPSETAEALETVVRQGKALTVGVSNYTPSQFAALQSNLSIPLVTNQLEFSVKTVENFFNGASDDLFQRKLHPMAWSPLGGGSVFGGKDEQSVRLRKALTALAEKHGVSVDTIMYAWLFTHPLGIMAITGTMNIDRVKTAVDALQIKLTYEEWYTVLAASRGYDVP